MTAKRIWIVLSLILGTAVLAGAAFLAAKLLGSTPVQGAGLSRPGMVVKTSGQGGKGAVTYRLEIEKAPELPQTQADVAGSVVAINDNSLTVAAMVKGAEPGNEASGPRSEVVITTATVVYRDATFDNIKGPPKQGEKIQQKVELMPAAQITTDDMVTVWGQKRGDRFIAEMIVVNAKMIIKKGP